MNSAPAYTRLLRNSSFPIKPEIICWNKILTRDGKATVSGKNPTAMAMAALVFRWPAGIDMATLFSKSHLTIRATSLASIKAVAVKKMLIPAILQTFESLK